MKHLLTSFFLFTFILMNTVKAQMITDNEKSYRPSIHFTPRSGWMNDPNGMVFYNGVYHLFYQHNPNAPVWGPMHWGHATSKDLIHWEHQPIAIYPDSIGTIFSGSAVLDIHNTSGFGNNGKAPLVAIYTQHNMDAEKAGRDDYQNQSISYSNDEGKTWTAYAGNPVIHTPHLKDFRDPKVFWHAPSKHWIMSLAVGPFIEFYSSANLKDWKKESQVGGEGMGVHDGNWECPDLLSFPITENGKQKNVWVLIVNVNPGAPNKGSGTQYFVGDFDGHSFTPYDKKAKWMDYGPDNYAGVTWSNTGERKILAGWMSNWLYAQVVPTEKWRSGLTIPRDLQLTKIGMEYYLVSSPIKELQQIESKKTNLNIHLVNHDLQNNNEAIIIDNQILAPMRLQLGFTQATQFDIVLSNAKGEQVVIGFDPLLNQYYIDRTHSGLTTFHKDYAAKSFAPRLSTAKNIKLDLIIDKASVELFADEGVSVMTSLFFPTEQYNKIELRSTEKTVIKNVDLVHLKSIF